MTPSSKKQRFSILGLMLISLAGCGGKHTVIKESNVAHLLTRLPNLTQLGIVTCNYTWESRTSTSAVPSPSDTKVTISGTAALSPAGAERLKGEFTWEPLSRANLPKLLAALVPPGDLLFSPNLNASFKSNASLPQGFVVILSDGKWNTLFFAASDVDHSLE